jgi:hypothetical protein
MRLNSLLFLLGAAVTSAQVTPTAATGPAIGSRVPDFQAVDQSGATRSLASILGPQGALLVFFRSADW